MPPPRSHRVFLSLGSNLGDRKANLEIALHGLATESVNVVKYSSIYETEPRDVPDQPWFFNIVVEAWTSHLPRQLLKRLLEIERRMGRVRNTVAQRGPRLIDIDILLFERAIIETDELTVPHPRLAERRFVLEPLLEIAPGLKLPRSNHSISGLLAKVQEQTVRRSGESLKPQLSP